MRGFLGEDKHFLPSGVTLWTHLHVGQSYLPSTEGA